ncbi:MAG TPA: DUF488 domain-containing protein [Terriglobales bacterium]|nr:DUF488 domain-containing protein [Terriglobales bacterium]
MPTLYTLGHSTRAFAEFLRLLAVPGIAQIADVRTIPRSRHNPQFAQPDFERNLHAAGIGYRHFAALGGLRHARPDSVNTGWRNLSFRGFADYMQTPAFAEALAELEAWARALPTAVVCAEAVPWRCHRSLIADALQARGWNVLDIIGLQSPKPHRATPFLRVVDGQLTYPPE